MLPHERMHATTMQPQESVSTVPVVPSQGTVPLLKKSDLNASPPPYQQRMPSLPWSSTYASADVRLPMRDGMQRRDFLRAAAFCDHEQHRQLET